MKSQFSILSNIVEVIVRRTRHETMDKYRGPSPTAKRTTTSGSSCRRVSRPAKVSRRLTGNEGPNLGSGLLPTQPPIERAALRRRTMVHRWRDTARVDLSNTGRIRSPFPENRHLRSRMSGGVGAGGVNAPGYPISTAFHPLLLWSFLRMLQLFVLPDFSILLLL